MLLPIGDDQVEWGCKPIFTYGFIALNILIYFLFTTNNVVTEFGAIPVEISNGVDLFTLFSSMFLHGGFMHLFGNMLFMWIFADNIEATMGNIPFLIFYLLGGVAASSAHIALDPSSAIPMIGASGAISAVLGAYFIMFPQSRINTIVIVFRVYLSAFIFLLLYMGYNVYMGMGALGQEGAGVAWWAHIGGFAFGILGGLLYRSKAKTKTLTGAHHQQA